MSGYKDDARNSRKGKMRKMGCYADGGLVDESGNSPKNDWRDLRPSSSKNTEAAQAKGTDAGSGNRTFGEKVKAAARAMFESDDYRSAVANDRDPKNPLYDRRKQQ